jgi:hypothetical protein
MILTAAILREVDFKIALLSYAHGSLICLHGGRRPTVGYSSPNACSTQLQMHIQVVADRGGGACWVI